MQNGFNLFSECELFRWAQIAHNLFMSNIQIELLHCSSLIELQFACTNLGSWVISGKPHESVNSIFFDEIVSFLWRKNTMNYSYESLKLFTEIENIYLQKYWIEKISIK